MGRAGITVEIEINAPMERVWELTQTPELHARWDARFSQIVPIADLAGGGYRFEYSLKLPFHTIRGLGTSLGERRRPDGTRTSALRFTTSDRLSPIGDGRGYWRYVPVAADVERAAAAERAADDERAAGDPHPPRTIFLTGYDYQPGWGALLDRLVLRRCIGWLTAWSFDRLRIWAETGVEPERWPLRSVLWWWRAGRPRARRCTWSSRNTRALDRAPLTLSTLEAP